MKKKTFNDEIDLADLFVNLWEQKFKIIIITSVFFILGNLYYSSKDKTFIAKTNIKPISNFENQKYKAFNSFTGKDLDKIDSTYLLSLFINKIEDEEIIKKGIIKFKLLNKADFQNEQVYKDKVREKAILIINNMTPPLDNEKDESENQLYWKFNHTIYDKEIWRDFLKFIENETNENVRLSLLNQFNEELKFLKINSEFELEDIEQNISNELDDYETLTSNRLAFLKEQAEIARALNIEKNTLEIENFKTDNTIVTNIKSENSYYLKGYEMIEKEISLINSRENKQAFISNLIALEKNKRSILQNKKIDRLSSLFTYTPINNSEDFKAAKIDYLVTSYEPQQSKLKILSFSVVIGLLISFLYIFANNIISSRK